MSEFWAGMLAGVVGVLALAIVFWPQAVSRDAKGRFVKR